jgi:ABC-type glycerol-3-phosphate transport system substrate-binding protein
MTARRFLVVLLACALTAAALGGTATAAKAPKYQVYMKCTSKTTCTATAYFNNKHTKFIAGGVTAYCTADKKTYVSTNYSGTGVKVKNNKFSWTQDIQIYDAAAKTTTSAKATVNGTLKAKEKVTYKYSVDKVPDACKSKQSGTVKLKYKGTQSGG